MGFIEFLILGFDLWVFIDVIWLLLVLFYKIDDKVTLIHGYREFFLMFVEVLNVICVEMGGRVVFILSGLYMIMSLLVFLLCFSGIAMYCNTLPSFFGVSFFFSFVLWLSLVILGELLIFRRMYELYRLDIMPRLVFVLCIMEAFSFSLRLISLAVRLSANLVSGHLLLYFMVGLFIVVSYDVFVISGMGLSLLPFLFYMSVEVGVCMVQSYIFGFLTLMYLNAFLD